MSRNSPNKQATAPSNDSLENKLLAYQAQGSLEKLKMIDQLRKVIQSKDNNILQLSSRLKYYQNLQRQRVNKAKVQNLTKESIQRVKQKYDKQIQKLKIKITQKQTQCNDQKVKIQKYQQDTKQQANNDQFLEDSKKQIQAELKLSQVLIEKKLLSDKYESLKKQGQTKKDQESVFLNSKVDQLKGDYEKLLKATNQAGNKFKTTVNQLSKEKQKLEVSLKKAEQSAKKSNQNLKSSNQLTRKLIKYIAEKGQRQSQFKVKVSKISDNQLENNFTSEKDLYEKEIKNIITDLYDSNKTNKKQKEQLENKLKQQKLKAKQLQSSKLQYEQELETKSKEFKYQIASLTSSLEAKSREASALSTNLRSIQTQLTVQKEKCSKLESELKTQKSNCLKETKLKQKALQEITTKQLQIQNLTMKNEQLESQVKHLTSQVNKKNIEITGLTTSLKELQVANGRLNKRLEDLNKQKQILNEQCQTLISRGKQLDLVIQQQRSKCTRLQGQKRQISTKLSTSQGNYSTLNIQHTNVKGSKQMLQDGFKKLVATYNKCLIQPITYAFLNRQIRIDEPRPDRVGDIERDLQQIGEDLRMTLRSSRYFNNSKTLNETQVDFLIDAIEIYTKRSIQNSFLVYKYDTINPVNFHSYIDKKQNLLLVIKLANGYVVGGFTEYPIDKARIEKPGSGFIFNCNLKKSYHVKNDARLPVVSYDDYFCLFGNAEIRLKSQEAKMFSNFGIASSTFETGRQLRTKFLNITNANDNQLDLETYEFYQITFKR